MTVQTVPMMSLALVHSSMELSDFSFDRDIRPRHRQKQFDWVPIILVLGMLFLLAFVLDHVLHLTDVAHAQGISATNIVEDYEGETLEMCEKYIESRTK